MKIEISEYYKNKGVISVNLWSNKEPRRNVTLKYNDGKITLMSYAKYLYTSYYSVDINDGEEVDHINKDKTDDRIENLQVISRKLNKNKRKMIKELIECECPVCHQKFLFEKRNLSTHPNPCCSRRCGSIKSHWKLNREDEH